MSVTVELVKESKIHQFLNCFDLKEIENSDKHSYSCKIERCQQSYTDKSSAIRHIRLNHRNIFVAIKEVKSQQEDPCRDDVLELRVRVDVEQILNACVDLVTINALPLRLVDFPAFRTILDPYRIALERKGIRMNIDRHKITRIIEHRAVQLKHEITAEVKNKLICLMVDIASRFNRSILGINVAFIKDSVVIHRTIGMHALHMAHTANHICQIIIQNLKDYGLDLDNVFAITTDNGQNMIKAISLLNAAYQENKQSNSSERPSNADCDTSSISSDDSVDTDTLDGEFYSSLLDSVRHSLTGLQYNDLVSGVSCAAHCFHLIVTKGIAQTNTIKNVIEKSRELVKKLRTPSFRYMIETRKLRQAILDVPTRWNSIYSMVSKIVFELHSTTYTQTHIYSCILFYLNSWSV